MNNRFGNSFGNPDLKNYYKTMYSKNKVLIFLSLGSFLALILTGTGFINSFFSAYLLFISGILYRQYFSMEKLIISITMGILAGFAFYILLFFQSLNPTEGVMAVVGSAAFAVLAAVATYAPNGEISLAFFGRVKLKWIAIIIIGLDLLTLNFKELDPRISHLGGVLYGFLSVYLASNFKFKKGKKSSSWFRRPGPYYKKPKNSTYTPPPVSKEKDEEYNARKNREQKEIDAILDKIKKAGYDSLSAEDKKRLFEQSKR